MKQLKIKKTYKQWLSIRENDRKLEEDNTCIICDNLCTSNSSCSDRYYGVQGVFKNHCENYEESLCVLHVCDKCFDIYEGVIDDDNTILFLDDQFEINGNAFRMND